MIKYTQLTNNKIDWSVYLDTIKKLGTINPDLKTDEDLILGLQTIEVLFFKYTGYVLCVNTYKINGSADLIYQSPVRPVIHDTYTEDEIDANVEFDAGYSELPLDILNLFAKMLFGLTNGCWEESSQQASTSFKAYKRTLITPRRKEVEKIHKCKDYLYSR